MGNRSVVEFQDGHSDQPNAASIFVYENRSGGELDPIVDWLELAVADLGGKRPNSLRELAEAFVRRAREGWFDEESKERVVYVIPESEIYRKPGRGVVGFECGSLDFRVVKADNGIRLTAREWGMMHFISYREAIAA